MGKLDVKKTQKLNSYASKNKALLNISLQDVDENAKISFHTWDDVKQIPVSKLIPAPKDLNFFEPLDDTKRLELRLSIADMGIIQPLHVWEQPDGNYMILAGHNRTSIVKDLYEETKSEKYLKVPCIVYSYEELNDHADYIEQIINETNSLQRTEFTTKERVNLIKYKLNKYKTQKDDKGRTIKELGENLGINKSTIYDDLTIGNKLIPEILEYYYNSRINRKAALNIARLNEEIQEYIVTEYEDKIKNRYFSHLPKEIDSISGIQNYLTADDIATHEKKVYQYHVPVEFEDEFKAYVDKWLKLKGLN